MTDRADQVRQQCADLMDLAKHLAASASMASSLDDGPAHLSMMSDSLTAIQRELNRLGQAIDDYVEAAQAEQVEAAVQGGEPLKLLVGPGETMVEGWTNVDIDQGDVLADLRRPLPFPDGCASHIYCSHVLEHLRNPDETYRFLSECRRVLRRGGKIRVVVPNIAEYLRACLDGDASFWETHQQTWPWSRTEANRLDQTLRYAGAGTYSADFFGHQHGYDASSLVDVLATAGFAPVKLSAFQSSTDPVFVIDDRSLVAHVEHDGRPLSLFAEGFSIF